MTNAPTPHPLPQSGGSYTRQADGSLVLTEEPTLDASVAAEPPPEPVAATRVQTGIKAPVKSPVKEA